MIVVGMKNVGQCQYTGQSYEPILPVFIRGVFSGVQSESTISNVSQQSQSVDRDNNDKVIVNLLNRTINEISEVIINSSIDNDPNRNDSSFLESNQSITTPKSVNDINTSYPRPQGNNCYTKFTFL